MTFLARFRPVDSQPYERLVLVALAGLGLVLALRLGFRNSYNEQLLFLVALNAILVITLYLVLGLTGQFVLATAAFWGVGSYTGALLMLKLDWPFWAAVVAAGLLSGAVGFILGAVSLRLGGHYLALASVGFSVVIVQILTNWTSLTRGSAALIGIPAPQFGDMPVQRGLTILTLLVFCAVFLGVWLLRRSRYGLAAALVKEDEALAEAVGVDTFRTKLLMFTLSGVVAGAAGPLHASHIAILQPHMFDIFRTVELLMMLVIGGMTSLFGAVIGAVVLTLTPEYLRFLESDRPLFYGLVLLLAVGVFPSGLAGVFGLARVFIVGLLHRFRIPSTTHPGGDVPAEGTVPDVGSPMNETKASSQVPSGIAAAGERRMVLEAEGISKRFGGVHVLDGISVGLREGEVTALIGPNGAGKTTFFNVVTGFLPPDAGRIRWKGKDVTSLKPSHRVRLGLVRTFQQYRVLGDQSLLQNIAIPSRVSGVKPPITPEELLSRLGVSARFWTRPIQETPAPVQRMAEVARAALLDPEFLLLDEPLAGLDEKEVEAVCALLKHLAGTGTTILVVEHRLEAVFSLVDRVLVLANRNIIFDGVAQDAVKDPSVQQAYLGTAS